MKNEILEAERKFQDAKVTDHARSDFSIFYEDNTEVESYVGKLLSKGQGKILIYGCGDKDITEFLKYGFSEVVGIDLSPKSIEKINNIISEKSLQKNVKALVMDAHDLKFENETFDVVFGNSILHHLDLEKSSTEINRVLKKNGQIIFLEPLGINPLITWYRNRTPEARTEYEHPFVRRDLQILSKYFAIRSTGFYFLTILSFGFRVFIKSKILYKISRYFLLYLDFFLLFILPPLKYLCWIIVIAGEKLPNNQASL